MHDNDATPHVVIHGASSVPSFKSARCLALVILSAITTSATAQESRARSQGNLKTDVGPSAIARLMAGEIVDLTHSFDRDTIYWPTETGFDLIRGKAGITEKGYYYAANRFAAAEHGGTHLDAPIHFFEGRHTVDQIPLDKLIGEAVVVDVTRSCAEIADYQVDVADLHRWEEAHNRQLVDVIVLLRTGHGEHWNDRERYLGTDKTGPAAVADLHFPGLAPDAARWLVEHRSIKAIGIDTPSIDYGPSNQFQTHVTLCAHNVPVFENVTNLDELPLEGACVIALPMKIGGGSGAPLRIIAITQ